MDMIHRTQHDVQYTRTEEECYSIAPGQSKIICCGLQHWLENRHTVIAQNITLYYMTLFWCDILSVDVKRTCMIIEADPCLNFYWNEVYNFFLRSIVVNI